MQSLDCWFGQNRNLEIGKRSQTLLRKAEDEPPHPVDSFLLVPLKAALSLLKNLSRWKLRCKKTAVALILPQPFTVWMGSRCRKPFNVLGEEGFRAALTQTWPAGTTLRCRKTTKPLTRLNNEHSVPKHKTLPPTDKCLPK